MKHQFICSSCQEHFTLTSDAKYCPICSGALISKTVLCANQKIEQLEKIMPILNKKYSEFAEIYAQYKIINETLRTYAARGIIDRSQVVDFKPETLTSIFYKTRQHNKKNKSSV